MYIIHFLLLNYVHVFHSNKHVQLRRVAYSSFQNILWVLVNQTKTKSNISYRRNWWTFCKPSPFGLLKWRTVPSSLIMFTSSMFGIILTDNFFNWLCNFLSSVVAVLCTTFFLRLWVPYENQHLCDQFFYRLETS